MDGHEKKSKKPSATNSKPLETITFFVDASLGGKTVARALRNAGANVEVHDDHFAQGTPDETWLRQVGKRKWVVLTKDDRIRYRDLERRALFSAGVRAFVLTARGLRGEENADVLVRALPRILRFLRRQPAPFIAKIDRTGNLSMINTT